MLACGLKRMKGACGEGVVRGSMGDFPLHLGGSVCRSHHSLRGLWRYSPALRAGLRRTPRPSPYSNLVAPLFSYSSNTLSEAHGSSRKVRAMKDLAFPYSAVTCYSHQSQLYAQRGVGEVFGRAGSASPRASNPTFSLESSDRGVHREETVHAVRSDDAGVPGVYTTQPLSVGRAPNVVWHARPAPRTPRPSSCLCGRRGICTLRR
ncbi:hypothetical protein C8Q77DRAFT_171289 [Trametes polyzona]|nr:hypothetical protein C8Q77DRAFT_171289 [Trametes polyzona]